MCDRGADCTNPLVGLPLTLPPDVMLLVAHYLANSSATPANEHYGMMPSAAPTLFFSWHTGIVDDAGEVSDSTTSESGGDEGFAVDIC
eukprot:SAG31_NODE_2498_length_5598_cov_2.801600_7_plen_88_part_00